MSLRITKLVWDQLKEGGNVKLALLCLADYADDNGICWPSMSAIARRLCRSESQTRRAVHQLIDAGIVEVIGNALGGDPGSSRRYRILIERLTPSADASPTPSVHDTPAPSAGDTRTPGVDATPSAHATPCMDARDPLHGCAPTPSAGDTLTVIEPSLTVKRPSRRKSEQTIKTYLDTCKRDGVEPIPADDKVWDYAEKVRLPEGLLELCWKEFRTRHLNDRKAKRQKDWPQTFRNCVRDNWYKLWYVAADGSVLASSAGRLSERAHAPT